MTNLTTLDVLIGLSLTYLLLSLLAATVREWVEHLVKSRGAHLHSGIRELLADPELVRAVYTHPLIFGLYRGGYEPPTNDGKEPGLFSRGRKLPSYIPSG